MCIQSFGRAERELKLGTPARRHDDVIGRCDDVTATADSKETTPDAHVLGDCMN